MPCCYIFCLVLVYKYITAHPVIREGKKEFEVTKGVIKIRKSKKNRQHNGQKQKDKHRSTKHTHKTKDRVTRTPLKPGMNSGAPEG